MSALIVVLSILTVCHGHIHLGIPEECGQDDILYEQKMLLRDPLYFTKEAAFEQAVQRAKQLALQQRRQLITYDEFNVAAQSLIYANKPWHNLLEIPINFHILYNPSYSSTSPNLSYEQIISQLIVLINDLNKQNWDWLNTPDEFIERVTNYEITFKLSKIIRKETSIIEFYRDYDDPVYYDIQGGSDIIDGDTTLNIWVMDISGGLLGRSQYPWADAPNTDGILIWNKAFGSKDYDYNGDFYLDENHDLGRTGTHVCYFFLFLDFVFLFFLSMENFKNRMYKIILKMC